MCDFILLKSILLIFPGKWAQVEVVAMKALSEKIIYLSPQLLKKHTVPLHNAVLKKANSFSFIPTKLSKSPSAASLIEERKMTGSVNFYLGQGRGKDILD